MRKRVWIIAAFAAIISGWMAMQPSPVSVDVAHVERGTMLLTVTDDGRTRIREKYTVSAPLAARLVRIDLEPGDRIEAGETPLAVLQPTNPALLDPRELAEARARASSAEARLNQLEPRLTLAKEKLNFAESELGRLRQLEARKSTSSNEVDAAELEFDSASANYSDVVFAQEIAAFELQLAKAALEHTAIDGSADATDSRQLPIVAPITGQVLRVFQESATVVTPGEPLLEIGDPSDLEVEVDVLSTDAVRIRPGAAVFLENWGGAEALHGKVRLVEPAAFTKVSALGIEEQRVNVIIDFDTDSKDILPGDGYRVDAAIVIWEGQDVVKVPSGALFRANDQWSVFVARKDRAVLTPVSLGHRNDMEAEVLSGLVEGDVVIVHPGDNLQDATLISIRNE